jgi:hypothetical protein
MYHISLHTRVEVTLEPALVHYGLQQCYPIYYAGQVYMQQFARLFSDQQIMRVDADFSLSLRSSFSPFSGYKANERTSKVLEVSGGVGKGEQQIQPLSGGESKAVWIVGMRGSRNEGFGETRVVLK